MTLTYKQKLKIFHDKFIEFSSEEISRYEKTGTGIFDIKSDFKPIIPSFVKHIPIIGIPAVSVEVSSHWHEPSLIERVNRAFNSINYNNQIKKLLSNAIREVAIDFEDKLDAIKDETEISKIISFAAIATYKLFSYLRENELGEKPLEKVIVEAIFQQSLWQTIWVGEDVFTRRLEGNERRYYKFVSEADIMDYVERGRKSAIPFSEYIRGMYSLHEDVQIVLHKDVSKENREKIDVSYGNLNGYDFDTSIPEIEIPRIKETVNVHALRLNDMEDKATKMALQFEYTMQVQREAQLQHQSIHSNDIYFCNVREAVANFIGREEQLEQIHEYFSKHGNIVQVIGGLGGIGKTQTVLQYIKYHEEEYGYRVRWFSAESKMTLDSEFREFAQILKIDVDKKSEQEILKLVKVKLASQIEKSLLIFDNVEDYEIIKEYLPSGGVKQHHIIITARNSKDYEDGASILGIKNIIKLEPFSPTEAVKYIKTTLPEAAESEALKLATLFDNVPLGLSQSVAYIKNNDIDIATYLDEYHRIRNEQNAALLEILHDPKYDPHISNIYITLSMTLDSLAYVPKAVKLLKLCSYLNSDNIPDYMFDSLFDNKIEKNRVIAVLKGYSLISVRLDSDTKFIHVHKIVQEAIRINIGDESVVVLQQAMELVHIQMVQDYDNRSSLKNYKSTLQHAISLIDHHHDIINIDFANTLDGVVAELHNDCGVLYRILGQWDNAETSYKSAIQLYKKVYGEEHENISMVIDNLGVVYLHVGKIQIALDSFMESLRILKIIDIEDHQAIPEVLNNIGHAYLALKNTKLALENFQQAQIIFTRIYEEEHPFVAETILNIGIVYRDLGQYQISLNYLEQALRIYKIKYDDTVPAVVSTINQIAVVYGYLGKYQESLVKFEQVLAIRTIIFGENHPTIAEIINNIGATLYNLEKHSEALIFLDKALKLYQASYGKESYYSAIALGHIGAVHHKCERYQEALDYYTQALNICMDTFGDKHPEVARLTGNIGQVYFQLRKYEKALENYQQALEIYKEFYGEEHPEVATILDNIGQVYKDLEKYEDALSHFEQALIIRKAVYSDGKHFHIAMSMNNIGVSCYKLKRYQDAQNNYEQALVLYKSIYGDKHSDIATTLDNIGDVYEDSEQYQNALNYYEQALVIRKSLRQKSIL